MLKEFFKLLIILILVFCAAVVVGFLMQSFQNGFEDEFTIIAKNKETRENVAKLEISTYPKVPVRTYPKLAGTGVYKMGIGSYTLLFIELKADGYKNAYKFKIVKPYEEIVVNMKPKSDKTEKEDPKTPEKKKENKKENIDVLNKK